MVREPKRLGLLATLLASLLFLCSQPLAVLAIDGYQRFLSPHKGFRCAHRVYFQGDSCSQYAKHQIQGYGLWVGLNLLKQRFQDCRWASDTLQADGTWTCQGSNCNGGGTWSCF